MNENQTLPVEGTVSEIKDATLANAVAISEIAAKGADDAKAEAQAAIAVVESTGTSVLTELNETKNQINNLKEDTTWHEEKLNAMESGLQTTIASQSAMTDRLMKLQETMEAMAVLLTQLPVLKSQNPETQSHQLMGMPVGVPVEVQKEKEAVQQVEEEKSKKRRRFL